MPINQTDTLQNRLAKRRNLRNKVLLHKKSIDDSEVTSIHHSPTATQSLDRKSSKRTSNDSMTIPSISSTTMPNFQRISSSSTKTKNSESPPIDNSFFKQTHRLSEDKTNSTPILPQISRIQSSDFDNDKNSSSKSLPINEHEAKHLHQDEKSIIDKEPVSPLLPPTTEKSNTNQQEPRKDSPHSHRDMKPIIIKETVSPVLPSITEKSNTNQQEPRKDSPHSHRDIKPIIIKETVSPVLPLITEKSNTNQHEPPKDMHTNSLQKLSILNRIQNLSPHPLDHPSSHPQSNTDYQTHFNFPPLVPIPLVRAASEQISTANRRRHQPIDSPIAKQNSPVVSYLFNKRIIDAELSRTSSYDSDESQPKTVWD